MESCEYSFGNLETFGRRTDEHFWLLHRLDELED